MEANSKLAIKIKGQITRYANELSADLSRPKRKFLLQMLYGIQASEDVKLSNVARVLNEDIDLIKTEDRLSRQISQEDLTEEINQKIILKGRYSINKYTVLALDLSDVAKPHSRKMEYLAKVWDGSEGKVEKGYWLCSVTGAEIKGSHVAPLYNELFSQDAEGFESENAQILKAVESVADVVDDNGIWAIDRGGDREKLILPLLQRGVQFVIRSVGDRHDESKRSLEDIANKMRCPFIREVVLEKAEGKREKRILQMGVRRVKLPFTDKPLNMVVVKGWGEKPMMLLTNLRCKRPEEFVHFILEVYLTRWKCEESFRFIKQCYQLEDVRVRSYIGLRNTVALVHAVFYFISMILGQRLKLNILLKRICEKAQRFFEIPVFKNYAIADGIFKVLFGMTRGPEHTPKPENYPQLWLPLEMTP